jgi:hypothetical protein
MSSIIRDWHAYHGISVFGRGVFTNDESGWTYTGQIRDGHACGLGVATRSNGYKVYTEHGPDGWFDGRYLCRTAGGYTYYDLFERGESKESARVYANGRCTYNHMPCAPDDPRLLALIAHVGPVEVRPAARAPRPPLVRQSPPSHRPMDRPARFGRRSRSPQPLPPRYTPTPHAVTGGCATQPNSSKARPRSGACAGCADVGGARAGPSCTLTTAHLVHTKPR